MYLLHIKVSDISAILDNSCPFIGGLFKVFLTVLSKMEYSIKTLEELSDLLYHFCIMEK